MLFVSSYNLHLGHGDLPRISIWDAVGEDIYLERHKLLVCRSRTFMWDDHGRRSVPDSLDVGITTKSWYRMKTVNEG